MKTIVGTALGISIILLIPNTSRSHHNSIIICGANGGEIIDVLVDREFPPTPVKRVDRIPLAINDIQCGAENNTFNVAIVVTDDADDPQNKTLFFGIFHITFSVKEKTIRYSTIAPWGKISEQNKNAIVDTWCNFIKNKYPDQQKESGCQ